MIIDIDCGNSRLKWRTSHSDHVHRHDYKTNQNFTVWDDCAQLVNRVRVSSVADETLNLALQQYWSRTTGIDIEFAKPQQSTTSIPDTSLKNGYDDYNQLGIDRWLAMLACWKQTNNNGPVPDTCLVVDAGTATTIDVIDRFGQHLGGYIVPGIQLLQHSLQNTAMPLDKMDDSNIFAIDRIEPDSIELGKNTNTAIESGCIQMTVGFIAHFTQQFANANKTVQLYLCGGYAEPLLPRLVAQQSKSIAESIDIHHYPNAVLDGLAIALP